MIDRLHVLRNFFYIIVQNIADRSVILYIQFKWFALQIELNFYIHVAFTTFLINQIHTLHKSTLYLCFYEIFYLHFYGWISIHQVLKLYYINITLVSLEWAFFKCFICSSLPCLYTLLLCLYIIMINCSGFINWRVRNSSFGVAVLVGHGFSVIV